MCGGGMQTSHIRRQNILDLPFVLRFRTIVDRAFPIFILYFYSEHLFAFRAGHAVIAFTTGQAQNAFCNAGIFVNVRFLSFHICFQPEKLFKSVFIERKRRFSRLLATMLRESIRKTDHAKEAGERRSISTRRDLALKACAQEKS